jgi:phosphonate transport system permease protein
VSGASAKSASAALDLLEAAHPWLGPRRLRLALVLAVVALFYGLCFSLAQVDPVKLASGLPKLAHWLAQAWPPRIDALPVIVERTAETIAMASVGTTAAALLALPLALLGSRNLTPLPGLYYPVRWFLNVLRGIDSFVFALLFVAAVGLGPFCRRARHCIAYMGQCREAICRSPRKR